MRDSEIKMCMYVHKTKGDYTYRGLVVGIVQKTSGALRYVVENDNGMLFIFSAAQLEEVPE